MSQNHLQQSSTIHKSYLILLLWCGKTPTPSIPPSLCALTSSGDNICPPWWEGFERLQLNESISKAGGHFRECHFSLPPFVGILPRSPSAFSHQQDSWTPMQILDWVSCRLSMTSIIKRENINPSVYKWPTFSYSQFVVQSPAFERVSQAEPTNPSSPLTLRNFEIQKARLLFTITLPKTLFLLLKLYITHWEITKASPFHIRWNASFLATAAVIPESLSPQTDQKHTHTHTHISGGLSQSSNTHHGDTTDHKSPASLLKLHMNQFSKLGQWTHTLLHTLILYTGTHTHTNTHVVQTIRFFHGGSDSASRLDSPSTWRHVSFVVYAFISLLNWTLWTQSPPHPPPPPVPSCPPALHLPPATKGAQIQYGFNKE